MVIPNNFKLIYRASIVNDKIDEIWEILVKNKESNLFLVIETKEGAVFGAVRFPCDKSEFRGFIFDYSNSSLSPDKIIIFKQRNIIKFGKYFDLSNEFMKNVSYLSINDSFFICGKLELFSFSGLQI